jgi:aspartyl aminopeptidase
MPSIRVDEETYGALSELKWVARSLSLNGVIRWLIEESGYGEMIGEDE